MNTNTKKRKSIFTISKPAPNPNAQYRDLLESVMYHPKRRVNKIDYYLNVKKNKIKYFKQSKRHLGILLIMMMTTTLF